MFIHYEVAGSTRYRVAPTRASTLDYDWRRPPPHESCSTVTRPLPLPSLEEEEEEEEQQHRLHFESNRVWR